MDELRKVIRDQMATAGDSIEQWSEFSGVIVKLLHPFNPVLEEIAFFFLEKDAYKG